jgi:hypothetical protein
MDEKTLRISALFPDPGSFQEAVAELVRSGHRPHCFTPWPLHHLGTTLGLKRSFLGRPVLAAILAGCALALHLSWFTQAQDYPLNVGGKPFFAWPTFVVVILETGLLLGALTTMALVFQTSRLLPDPFTRLIDDRITDDRFCLVVPLLPQDDSAAILARLSALGAETATLSGTTVAVEDDAHA